MHESTKTYSQWPGSVRALVTGNIIDIGCGDSPISETATRFDMDDGDANHIPDYVTDKFDFVFSSHCLEHMYDPPKTILDWWELVKPGGSLAFIVPDEDLYEQGIFPSTRNSDHKHTFTISKQSSRSPKSINVLDLAKSLPGGTIFRLILQDHGYDRARVRWGLSSSPDQTLEEHTLAQIECVVIKDK